MAAFYDVLKFKACKKAAHKMSVSIDGVKSGESSQIHHSTKRKGKVLPFELGVLP